MNEYEVLVSTGEIVILKTTLQMDRVIKDIVNQSIIYANGQCLFTQHIVSIRNVSYC